VSGLYRQHPDLRLGREADWYAQVYEIGFIEKAAGWDGRERWVGEAVPVLID
jgi:hypothetical protein